MIFKDFQNEKKFLLIIITLAIIIRIIGVIIIGNFKYPQMYEHGDIARNMIGGFGYSMHFSYQPMNPEKKIIQKSAPKFEGAFIPPVNPYIIYYTFRIFGDNRTSYAILMLLNSLFSTIGVLLVYLILKEMGYIKAAKIGAVFSAVFLPNVFGITTFSGSALYQTLALAFIYFSIKCYQEQKIISYVLCGFIGGLLSLLRSEFLIIGPIIFLSTFIYNITIRKNLKFSIKNLYNLTVFIFSFILIVSPWVYRNTMLFGEFTTIVSHPWHEMWRGNNKLATGGEYDIYGEKQWLKKNRYPNIIKRIDSLPYNQNFELAIDSILKKETLLYIKNNPFKTFYTMAKRMLFIWTIDIYNPRTRHPINVIFVFFTVIPTFIGLITLYKSGRIKKDYGVFIIFLSFLVLYTMLFTVVNLIGRYQIYLLNICHPLAGLGIYEILNKIFKKKSVII